MRKLLLILVALLGFSAAALAQGREIAGSVVSAQDGEPLIGATIMPLPAGSGSGTATDIDGNFAITVTPKCKELQVSYVGMETQRILLTTIARDANVVIRMEAHASQLDEVIAVAYGTVKRSEYTGSASVVNSDKIQDALVSSVTSVLNGKVSGVQLLSSDGRPGSDASIRIRGVGSINASSNPLIVVDGVPYDGAISDIASSDVESMTVLKDAAANSLYGARGANGVVLITTKRGSSGTARITFDARWGANDRAIPNYNVLWSTDQYYELMYRGLYNRAYQNNGGNAEAAWRSAAGSVLKATGYQVYTVPTGEYLIGRNGKINPNASLGYSDGTYYYTPDNWTLNTMRNGFRQDYTLSISGGTDKLKYYISGSYLGDEGIIVGSSFNRLTTRATVDWQAKKWLRVGGTLNYAYTNSNRPGDMDLDYSTSTGNAFYVANQIAPVYPMFVRGADGKILYNESYGHRVYDYGDGESTAYTRNWMNMANPIGSLLYDTNKYLSDVFDGKWYMTVTPVEGLDITGNVGYWLSNDRIHLVGNPFYGQSASTKGSAEQYFSRSYTLTGSVFANYKHTFGSDHNIDLMAGYENYRTENEYLWGVGYNTYDPEGWWVYNTIDQKTTNGARPYQYQTMGILARAKYNYANRYFIQGSYRRDASSCFAPDKRWGNFFSVSAAWDIASEKFMQNATAVDQLKFKVSFGQNGNDNLGREDYYYRYFPYADQYQVTGADGVWNDATLVFKGNKDITWETSNNFNVGFDFSFFKGRLFGSAEYYQRTITDMLFFVPTATSLGYSSYPANAGSMRNNGFEIELEYMIFNKPDFSWSVNGNLTTAANKILSLPHDLAEKGQWVNGNQIFKEGKSRYQLYLPHYAGVDKETGEALYMVRYTDAYWAAHPELAAAGKTQEFASSDWSAAYYGDEDAGLDVNRYETGNLMPKVYGGFGTSLYAYGVDFSINFSYQAGGKIWDYTYQDLMHSASTGNFGQNWHADIRNSWTPENRDTDIPRINSADQYTDANSDRWLISSNYLSLNNITLGYTFPSKWTRKIGIESIRIYGAAENVALWSKRRGLDPRQGYYNSNSSTYSPIRTFSGGIKVQF